MFSQEIIDIELKNNANDINMTDIKKLFGLIADMKLECPNLT